MLGFTWYSLTDQIDWDSELAEQNNNVNACGLYDLNRKPHPVRDAYRMLLEEFGQMSLVPHAEIMQINTSPSTLKTSL